MKLEQNKKQPNNYNFQYGTTYLINPVLILIPRAIYPENQFFGKMNFLKENMGAQNIGFDLQSCYKSFVNFGYFGSFLVFFTR